MNLDHTALALVYTQLESCEVNSALRCCRHWSLDQTTMKLLYALRSTNQQRREVNNTAIDVNMLPATSSSKRKAKKAAKQQAQSIKATSAITPAAYDTDMASQIVRGPFSSRESEVLPWRQFEYDRTHCHALVRLHSSPEKSDTGAAVAVTVTVEKGEGEPIGIHGLTHRVWNHYLTEEEQLQDDQSQSNDELRFGALARWLCEVAAWPSSNPASSSSDSIFSSSSLNTGFIVLTVVDAQQHAAGQLTFARTGPAVSHLQKQQKQSKQPDRPTIRFHSFISATRFTQWSLDFMRYLSSSQFQRNVHSIDNLVRVFMQQIVSVHCREDKATASVSSSSSSTSAASSFVLDRYATSRRKEHGPCIHYAPLREDESARAIFFRYLFSDPLGQQHQRTRSLYVNISTGVSIADWLVRTDLTSNLDELYLINCVGSPPPQTVERFSMSTLVISGHPQYGCLIDSNSNSVLRSPIPSFLSATLIDCLFDQYQTLIKAKIPILHLKRCQFIEDDGEPNSKRLALMNASNEYGPSSSASSSSFPFSASSSPLLSLTYTNLLPLLLREFRLRFFVQLSIAHTRLSASFSIFLGSLFILTFVDSALLLISYFFDLFPQLRILDPANEYHRVNIFRGALWFLALIVVYTPPFDLYCEMSTTYHQQEKANWMAMVRLAGTVGYTISTYTYTLPQILKATVYLATIFLLIRCVELVYWSVTHRVTNSTRRQDRVMYQLRQLLFGLAKDSMLVLLFLFFVLIASLIRHHFVLADCLEMQPSGSCQPASLWFTALARWFVSFVHIA